MNNPSISVIMPVWNGERYLAEAIESILAQTFRDFEFIILDDGSTDRTPEILRKYAERDLRIRVIRLDHEGIVVALNHGVAAAKAKWIARMDCDDIAHPDRFSKQFKALLRSGAIMCHTHVNHIGDTKLIRSSGRFVRTKALLALRLCFHSPIIHPTVMFRRDIFLTLGGYRLEERHAEDFGLWGKLLEAGEVVGISEPLLDYRVHANSISKQQAARQQFLSEEIAKRHCSAFTRINGKECDHIYNILHNGSLGIGFADWLILSFKYIPRLRWQSLELWLWVFSRAVKIFYRRAGSILMGNSK